MRPGRSPSRWKRDSGTAGHAASSASPHLRALGALAIVVVVALPVLTLRLGLADAGSDPSGTTTRLAYDLLAKGFGPGFNGPLELVATLHDPPPNCHHSRRLPRRRANSTVSSLSPRRGSVPAATAAVVLVYPSTAPQAAETSTLLHTFARPRHPERRSG